MDNVDRRRFKRISARFDVAFKQVNQSLDNSHIGRTVNVCPGGLYLETDNCDLAKDTLLTVDLSIPPTPGLLELGGRISGFAKVLRADPLSIYSDAAAAPKLFGVAVEFCQAPKFSS